MEYDGPVRPRRQAVACDQCERWCHRTCGTGIEEDFYRRLVKNLVNLEWKCSRCESLMLPPPPADITVSGYVPDGFFQKDSRQREGDICYLPRKSS